MSTRRMAGGAAAAALALLASACADQLTSPAARLPGAPAFNASASAPTLVSNAVRYRDTGGRPATGRAGSAAVDALALLGRDGVTDVELTARAADPSNPAAGTIARAQAKVYSPDDSLQLTRSVDGGRPLRLEGLPRGTRVDVQANVTGIDPHRTDVVAVSQTVRMRPDLSVQAGAGSSQVYAGTPVVVGGFIRELNGDMGATADCVLLVDGQPVDQALGIWVNAGDRVNCFFTIPSLAAGTHAVTVRLDGVAPGDWDPSNDASTIQVTAQAQPVPMGVYAWVRNEAFTERNFWRTTYYSGGYGVDDVDETTRSGTSNNATINGYLGRGFAAPLTIRVEETDGGTLLQADEWVVDDYGSPVVCSNRWNTGQGTAFYFCSYFGTEATFQFYRSSGTVTYHSLGYHREWDDTTGDEYVYHWDNTDVRSSGGADVLSGEYGFSVSFTSGGDVTSLAVSAALEPFEEHYDEPDWCYGGGDGEWGWYDRTCYGGSYHATGYTGFGSFVTP
jgi:hypothetical protein